jgi:response regulator RpfG family c-di-GMP phosphodiesterase
VRLLLIDDDASFRALLRTTFEVFDIEVQEAESAEAAVELINDRLPDAIVLDVVMRGTDGLSFCRRLKSSPTTARVPVVVLSGSDLGTAVAADASGADAFVRKPFSPLELLAIVERLAGGLYGIPFRAEKVSDPKEQLLLYARDLRHLLEVERGQRTLLQEAYRETVLALTTALESKDTGTGEHSQRVQQYALTLARRVDPYLCDDPSLEYGFLLHDIGKIGIPDGILQKPHPLTPGERRLIQNHTLLGEQMLGGVGVLHGAGLKVVRSHHERWDGAGYPDALEGDEIPLGARIFAVADALDAMTSDRPYRRAGRWEAAADEIERFSGEQFDPDVVDAFHDVEDELQEIRRSFGGPVRPELFVVA